MCKEQCKKWPGFYIFSIVIRKSRCTVVMLSQIMTDKIIDVGKLYAIQISNPPSPTNHIVTFSQSTFGHIP